MITITTRAVYSVGSPFVIEIAGILAKPTHYHLEQSNYQKVQIRHF